MQGWIFCHTVTYSSSWFVVGPATTSKAFSMWNIGCFQLPQLWYQIPIYPSFLTKEPINFKDPKELAKFISFLIVEVRGIKHVDISSSQLHNSLLFCLKRIPKSLISADSQIQRQHWVKGYFRLYQQFLCPVLLCLFWMFPTWLSSSVILLPVCSSIWSPCPLEWPFQFNLCCAFAVSSCFWMPFLPQDHDPDWHGQPAGTSMRLTPHPPKILVDLWHSLKPL